MGRPKIGNRVRAVTVTLDVESLPLARKRAFENGWSLSEYMSRLLVADLRRKVGVAHRYPRRLGGRGA